MTLSVVIHVLPTNTTAASKARFIAPHTLKLAGALGSIDSNRLCAQLACLFIACVDQRIELDIRQMRHTIKIKQLVLNHALVFDVGLQPRIVIQIKAYQVGALAKVDMPYGRNMMIGRAVPPKECIGIGA